jgi:anti-sigma factor RsiW
MENIEAMLCAFIEGDLDEAGRAEIEKHLATNPQHRKLIADLIAQRQLLRDLPRVSAPTDVDESVRGQMERSILLEKPTGADIVGGIRSRRWPQMMTVAAILLLTAALGLIVYRTVVPTFKPAAYTQIAATKQLTASGDSELQTDIETAHQQNLAQSQPEEVATPSGAALSDTQAQADHLAQTTQPVEVAAATPPVVEQQHITSMVGKPFVVAPTTQPVSDDVRQLLTSSGYEISTGSNPPVVVTINSDDMAKTNRQVARFLMNQSALSWGIVRSIELKSAIQTQPLATQPVVSSAATQISPFPAGIVFPEPSRVIYVARGLTPQATQSIQGILSGGQATPILAMSVGPVQNSVEGLQNFASKGGAQNRASTLPSTQPTIAGELDDKATTIPSIPALGPTPGPVDVVIVVQQNSLPTLPQVPALPTTLPTTQPALVPTTLPTTKP